MTTQPTSAINMTRYDELGRMLRARRLELASDVQERKRDARVDNPKEHEVLDEGESSEADSQEDIGFALIQMKAEILHKIAMALDRLEEGTYGRCLDCRADIPEARLRALPFAVRCKPCEEVCESAERSERLAAQRRLSSVGLFHMSR